VQGAHCIVTATHAKSALFDVSAIGPDVALFPMGSHCELDARLVLEARYRVVDHLEQNKHRGEFFPYFENGSLVESDICAEIGDIVAGKVKCPPTDGGWGVASLIGVGSLDIAIAKAVYDVARSNGIGTEFEFLSP